jgi:hypothetical protein
MRTIAAALRRRTRAMIIRVLGSRRDGKQSGDAG